MAKSTRRHLFKTALGALAALPFVKPLAALANCSTPPKGKKIATNGLTRNFVLDAKTSKDKAYKAGQTCESCVWFKKPQDGWAKCIMVKGQWVPSCGWCTGYKVAPKKA